MNRLKSVFITTYVMLLMAVSAVAAWAWTRGGNPVAWAGVLLTTAPLLLVVSRLTIFRNVARTSARFPAVNGLAAIGAALAMWGAYSGTDGLAAPVLAVGAWIAFLLYAYWFSSFGGRTPSARLRPGAPLPAFTVTDAAGERVSSAQLTDRPAILMFFRGNWCPLCMAQVKELVARYRELGALGVRVALISPQPHGNTVALAQRFAVDFEFLTDAGNAAARALGIENVDGTPLGMQMFGYDDDTVLPTVIITGRDGRVLWAHETDNYRIRPEPDLFLDVLRRHGLAAAAV